MINLEPNERLVVLFLGIIFVRAKEAIAKKKQTDEHADPVLRLAKRALVCMFLFSIKFVFIPKW